MRKFLSRFLIASLITMLAASNFFGAAFAASIAPAQTGESIRASLLQAQLALSTDRQASAVLVKDAEAIYQTQLSAQISASTSEAHLRILSAFKALSESIKRGDPASFSAARAQVWVGIIA